MYMGSSEFGCQQSINQFVGRPAGRSVGRLVGRSVGRLVNHLFAPNNNYNDGDENDDDDGDEDEDTDSDDDVSHYFILLFIIAVVELQSLCHISSLSQACITMFITWLTCASCVGVLWYNPNQRNMSSRSLMDNLYLVWNLV